MAAACTGAATRVGASLTQDKRPPRHEDTYLGYLDADAQPHAWELILVNTRVYTCRCVYGLGAHEHLHVRARALAKIRAYTCGWSFLTHFPGFAAAPGCTRNHEATTHGDNYTALLPAFFGPKKSQQEVWTPTNFDKKRPACLRERSVFCVDSPAASTPLFAVSRGALPCT